MVKIYTVTSKVSGLKYKMRINAGFDLAYVTDDDEIVWACERRKNESMDDFISRAKRVLSRDIDF